MEARQLSDTSSEEPTWPDDLPTPDTSSTPFSTSDENSDLFDNLTTREGSPDSVMSLSSSQYESCFTYNPETGRSFSSRADIYALPADDEEIDRLDVQHRAILIRRRRNYVGPVREALKYDLRQDKAVLDLGCGTGIWLRQMAGEFPYCTFVGVDIAPIQPEPYPPNCRFEIDDFNLSLDHFYEQFNLVHTRLISSGVPDYERLIDEITKMLRPGGMVLLEDYDYNVYDRYGRPLNSDDPKAPNYSWVAAFLRHVAAAVKQKKGNLAAVWSFRDWLAQHPDLEDVEFEDAYFPCGPLFTRPRTLEEHRLNAVGVLAKRDVTGFISTARHLLIMCGSPESLVKWLEENAIQELEDNPQQCFRLHAIWARKKIPS